MGSQQNPDHPYPGSETSSIVEAARIPVNGEKISQERAGEEGAHSEPHERSMSSDMPEPSESTPLLAVNSEKSNLNIFQKIFYGLPQLSLQFGNSLINSWINYFYLPPENGPYPRLVSVGIFGALFMTGRILNALVDPPIGYFSDQSTFRFGRRLPLMLLGSPVLSLLFTMLWFPPFNYETTENAVYFAFVFLAYNVSYGLTVSPYTALLPEISTTKHERIILSTFSGVFALLGHGLGALVGPSLTIFKGNISLFGKQLTSGLQVLGLFGGCLHLICFALCLLVTRERPRSELTIPVHSSLFSELWIALRNKAFRSLVGVSALLPAGMIMVAAGFPYLCTQILERADESTPGLVRPGTGELWVGILSGIIFAGALFWMPLLGRFIKVVGKKFILLTAGSLSSVIVASISIVIYFPGDPGVAALVVVCLMTLPASFLFVLPPAVYADVVDYDERKTGVRREGIYAGAQSLCNKGAAALASALITYILSLGNSRENSTGISLLYLAAGMMIAAGTLLFSQHPIKM